jgi:cation:H+ antiporter
MHLLLAGQGMIVANGHRGISTGARDERHHDITIPKAIRTYTVAALVVIVAATWLPFVGEALATVMEWEQTFVGTLFIAAATSTPRGGRDDCGSAVGALDLATAICSGATYSSFTMDRPLALIVTRMR